MKSGFPWVITVNKLINWRYITMAKKTFHRLTRIDKDKTEWIMCQGDKTVVEGYTFYFCLVEFNHTTKPQHTLIEERSGVSVGHGDTKQISIDHFKDRLKIYGEVKFEELVEQSIEKYGHSPSYNRVSHNMMKS